MSNEKNARHGCVAFLDLRLFKTQPCPAPDQSAASHNVKKCPFYHDKKKDRRRQLGTYQSERCPNMKSGSKSQLSDCTYGEMCGYSHNRVEEFYHPDKYKAKFCKSMFQNPPQECEYGDICCFAHSNEELSVELIEEFEKDTDFYIFHFKTVWCPHEERTHEKDRCVYAHNWQDYRRKPNIFSYSKDFCSVW